MTISIEMQALTPKGKFLFDTISPILDMERKGLKSRLKPCLCSCLPSTGVRNWNSSCRGELSRRTRIITRCAVSLIFFSTLISATVVSSFYRPGDLWDEESLDLRALTAALGGLIAVAFFFVQPVMMAIHGLDVFVPNKLYQFFLAMKIEGRIKAIKEFQRTLDTNSSANPRSVARLIASGILNPATAALLLEKGNVSEFREMLQEFRALNTLPQLAQPLEALRVLIENPPEALNDYRIQVLLASDLIETEEDYLELRSILPSNDPRLQFLQPKQAVESERVLESTTSIDSEEMSDDPDALVVAVGDAELSVDQGLLCKKSHWFATSGTYEQQRSKIILSDKAIYKNCLIQVLRNLSQLSRLWQPMHENKADYYMELFECLHFYGFTQDLHCLGKAICYTFEFDADVVSLILQAPNVTQEISDYWLDYCYRLIKKPPDNDAYIAALDFGLEHFPEKIPILYVEYLKTARSDSPDVLKAVVSRLDKLKDAETFVAEIMLGKLALSVSLDSYKNDAIFLDWFAQLIRNKKPITLQNFKEVWALAGCNKGIEDLAIEYASTRQLSVIELWKENEVPDRLIHRLPY